MTVATSAPPTPHHVEPPTPAAEPATTSRAGQRLLIGLVALCAYAAFARGATDLTSETRLQVLLTGLAVAAAVAWLGIAAPAPSLTRRAATAVVLLTGFAVWCGLSLLWSVAPANTWVEVNRTIEYALFLALALAAASRASDATATAGRGFLGVAVAVALYALGGKVAPWIHIGPIDLDQTATFSRLRAPLDYWNALALVCVLGVPLALRTTTDTTHDFPRRLRALLALGLLLVTLGLTYSRGGVLALVVAVAATTWLGGPRLRGLAVVGLAALAAVPGLAYAFSQSQLTHDNVPLHDRVGPGLGLGLILIVSFAALALAGRALHRLEQRTPVDPAVTARTSRGLRLAALGAVVIAILAVAVSPRGLTGSISHQVDLFTQAKAVPVTDPSRLLSTNSGNRWVWWKEAAGAFSDEPIGGWGAGSFPVTHLLYRQPPALNVQQPHNVPLQFLAETGLVGALLALGAIGLLIAAAVERVRALPADSRERALAGACVAGGLAWAVHCVVDWDWDIPGATLPALLLLGVAARATPGPTATTAARRLGLKRPRSALAALALVTLALAAFAASAILPDLSQSKAQQALAQAAVAKTDGQLAHAQATAELAARLNPLAVEPLLDAAVIADRRNLRVAERDYLLRAVRRAPYDALPWIRLAYVAVTLGDRAGLLSAAHQALAVDPIGAASLIVAATAEPYIAVPQNSATATGTPLKPSP